MAPVPSSPSSKNDWRPNGDTESNRWVARVVFTLLLLVLTVVFFGIILDRGQRVHFVALPVVDYDPLVVPPIAFSHEDVEAFASVAPSGAFHNLRELQTSESMPLLRSRLGGIVRGPGWLRRGDGLILYISAHGVADDGVPYLLCSDYLRPGADTADGVPGRYRLADVLRQIAGSKAAWKLILLDAGQYGIDPQNGLPANEFPRLLEEEVRKINDPTLWVLTANRPLQMSRVSYPARRSMFGHSVTEGLLGEADLNGDRTVSLAELYRFVRDGVAAWVHGDVGTPAAQVPRLLHAGGRPRPEGIELVAVARTRPKRSDDAGKETPPAGDAGGEDDGDEPPGKPAGTAEDADAAASLAAAEQWAHRDGLCGLPLPRAWAPVDYAPHLWNLFEETLVEYERRCRCGDAYPPVPWEAIAPPHLPTFRHSDTLSDDQAGFPTGEGLEPLERLKRLIQQKNDLFARLPGYVRYRAHAVSLTGDAWGPAHEQLAKAIDEFRELAEAVERLKQPRTIDLEASATGQEIDRLAGMAGDLAEREQAFRRQLNEDGRHLAAQPTDAGVAARILALLQTPLLDTDVRAALAAALDSLDAEPLGTGHLPAGFAENPEGLVQTFTARQWNHLAEQAELEYRLPPLPTVWRGTVRGEGGDFPRPPMEPLGRTSRTGVSARATGGTRRWDRAPRRLRRRRF